MLGPATFRSVIACAWPCTVRLPVKSVVGAEIDAIDACLTVMSFTLVHDLLPAVAMVMLE